MGAEDEKTRGAEFGGRVVRYYEAFESGDMATARETIKELSAAFGPEVAGCVMFDVSLVLHEKRKNKLSSDE